MVSRIVCITLISFCALSVSAQETGNLKVKFIYGGDVPAAMPIKPDNDKEFCGKHPLMSERLIVNSDDKGIQNVILSVFTGRGDTALPVVKAEPKKVKLANDKCRFEPHVVVLRTGDTLEVSNPDTVGHNAKLEFLSNVAVNITIPAGATKEVPVAKSEPAPIPVVCNIHTWMQAYVVTLDHPYVGVSDKAGVLEIKDIPVGNKIAFRLWIEAAASSIKEVNLNGKPVALKRNNFELDIKPGLNDLGTITIPADA